MTDVYALSVSGSVPVSLNDMKAYMKVTSASDDTLLTSMLAAATQWGEGYTAREFRSNAWVLRKDAFEERILVRRQPVTSIDSVQYLKSGSLTTIAASVYYLKNNSQDSEILLQEDQEWPTDLDNREQGITIYFTTAPYQDAIDGGSFLSLIQNAIKRHVAFWYKNRGDCGSAADAAKNAGVTGIYDQFRIARV